MRYLSLGEALVIAEAVTGIDVLLLARSGGIGLLDSALHAPQAAFGGTEFYPAFVDKARCWSFGWHATTLCLMATSGWLGDASGCSAR